MIIRVLSRVLFRVFLFITYVPLTMADYVLTAPPRESREESIEIYQPIADYLGRVTGEKFSLSVPDSWSDYTTRMKNQEYDLLFDGPHFVSWRIKHLNHDIVAKLPDLHMWRIIARSDSNINSLDELVGQKVCAPKSPNFGYLILMSHYTDPDREPLQVITKSWKDGFDGVIKGDCVAAVLPKTNHLKFDPDMSKAKAVYTHLPYPNQAFTAGPRMNQSLKNKVRDALLSDEGQVVLSRLLDRFSPGNHLVAAENEEYEGISLVLKRAENFGASVQVSVNGRR